jgi:hypothetical protein
VIPGPVFIAWGVLLFMGVLVLLNLAVLWLSRIMIRILRRLAGRRAGHG